MNTISIKGCELTVNWHNKVVFEKEIEEVIDFKTVVIALIIPEKGMVDITNNIYGVIDSKIAWQVQDVLEYNANYAPFSPDSYVGIRVFEGDPELIVGTTFKGFRMLINPIDGRIVGNDGWVK